MTSHDKEVMMTEEEIRSLVPALRTFTGGFKDYLGRQPVQKHIEAYARGLISDLPRKSVEPIANAGGACVRSLQLLLTHHDWDEQGLSDAMQRYMVQKHLPAPGELRTDPLGVMGWIDETSFDKKGEKSPGVQRQYCGHTGKIDNCIVSVHLAVGYDGFTCLIDNDLYLPQSWAEDGQRRREAEVPEEMVFRSKCQIALEQVKRALGNGVRLDWIGFDEGYGSKPSFLLGLEAMGQVFIGEVPKTFRCFSRPPKYQSLQRPFVSKEAQSLVRRGTAFQRQKWVTYTVIHKTVADSQWRVKAGRVYISVAGHCHDRPYWLIVAKNTRSGEVKYFISNAPERTPLATMLAAAFSRWGIEHLFRVSKSEIGLGHYEGRKYRGLIRHMILCQLMLLFLAEQTTRLRGEKSAGHQGAGGAGDERPVRAVAAA
jgi:SRSO17 transposase